MLLPQVKHEIRLVISQVNPGTDRDEPYAAAWREIKFGCTVLLTNATRPVRQRPTISCKDRPTKSTSVERVDQRPHSVMVVSFKKCADYSFARRLSHCTVAGDHQRT